ncbi:MAG: SPASM domain-containing protein [Acidobacteriota bacterium]
MEVNARCNRRCSYCPVSVLPAPKTDLFMSESLFDRIVSELERVNFQGNLSYHLFNEPLLRRDLETLVRKAAARLPNAFQVLFTNGDLLLDERYTSLREAGIDHFIVTRHDYEPMPERPYQTIQFPSDLVLVNRGGLLGTTEEPLFLPCYAPTDMLIITVGGDVLLCCDDAERSHVMGNISVQTLEEIWFSPRFVHLRNLLQEGKRQEASEICRRCNNREYFGPGENDHKHLVKAPRALHS